MTSYRKSRSVRLSRFRPLASELLESRQLLAFTVTDLQVPNVSSTSNVVDIEDQAYLAANGGAWKTDGTVDGTTIIDNSANPTEFVRYQRDLVYSGANTLRRFSPSNGASSIIGYGTGGGFLNAGGIIYMNFESRLKRYDGALSADIGYPYPQYPQELTLFQGAIYFQGYGGPGGIELWVSDGTSIGTSQFRDFAPGYSSNPRELTVLGDSLYFFVTNSAGSPELWKTNGTSDGTVMLKRFTGTTAETASRQLTVVGNSLFFVAYDASNGIELWKTDGTPTGTVIAANIWSGSLSSVPDDLTEMNGNLYFSASGGPDGRELWKYDTALQSAVRVRDIVSGLGGSFPDELAAINGKLYFSADDQVHGREIWVSDGSTNGTNLAVDFVAGSGSSSPRGFHAVGNKVLFVSSNKLYSLSEDQAIAAPTGLTASDGAYTDKVHLQWNTSPGATGYEIWRSLTEDSLSASRIADDVTQSVYDDFSVGPGQTVYYWVKSKASNVTSGFSLSDSGFAALPLPNAPSSVLASDGTLNDRVRVTWASSANATEYEVWRSTGATAASATRIANGLAATVYDDTSALHGTQYNYWIVARNSSGASPFSYSDYGYRQVGTPFNLEASDAASTNSIALTWSVAEGATSYTVYRNLGNDPNAATNIVTVNEISYADTSVSPGVTYIYWVKAANGVSTSAFSTSNGGYLKTAPPSNVNASDGTSTASVSVAWSASPGATQYLVYRGTSNDPTTSSQLGIQGGTTYVDTAVSTGQTYYYWVKALNSLSTSDYSLPDTGYRLATVPTAPTGVTASDGTFNDRVRVGWSTTPNTDSYEIARNTTNDSATATVLVTNFTGLTYDDLTATAGTAYFYFVRSRNVAGSSQYSASDAGFRAIPVPTVPTNVKASDGAFTDHIDITWNPVANATSYEVWRGNSINSASATRIASNVAGITYTDSSASTGIYYYFIKAVNISGASGFSAGDPGFLSLSGPGVPSSVSATDGTFQDKVRVTWTGGVNSTSYEVWRSSVNDLSTATNISGNVLGSQYDDSSVSPGQANFYWVRGRNLLGPGPFSASDAGLRSSQIILVDSGQSFGAFDTNDLLVGDLDGDGDLDAYQANQAQGDRVYFNNGNGTFTDSGQSLGNYDSIYGDLGDVDGDGDLDAVIAALDKSVVWLNDGHGHFTDSGQRLVAEIPIDVELADLDGDKDLDAFITSAHSNAIWNSTVWLNDGHGHFTDSGQRLPGADARSIQLADLEGDGDLDAFVANRLSDLANRVWINDGHAHFTDSGLRLGSSHTQTLAVGDMNGDGKVDLFEANVNDEPNRVYLNNGNGTFTETGQLLGSNTSTDVGLGDMDGDGDLDAVVANYYEDGVLYLNDGTGHFSEVQTIANHTGQRIALGDFNRDGDLDLFQANFGQSSAVFFNITQRPYVTQMVRNDGDQHFERLNSLTFTFSDDVGASVNAADLILFNTRTNTSINTGLASVTPTGIPNQFRFNLSGLALDYGVYYVALRGAGIANSYGTLLDGNHDGIAGDDYQTSLRIAQLGDVNLDGSVDASDAGEMFAHWGGTGGTWASGDANFDGIVDAADAGEMFANWTGDSWPGKKKAKDQVFISYGE